VLTNRKAIAKEIANQNMMNHIGDGMRVSTLGADLQKEQQAKLLQQQTRITRRRYQSNVSRYGRVSAGSQNVNAQMHGKNAQRPTTSLVTVVGCC
jgi:hypothetical protein